MLEWEMLKIPRKELNEIMNAVNVTTVTKKRNLFHQKHIIKVLFY